MDLSQFDNTSFDRGASRGKELAWLAVRRLLFLNNDVPLYGLRRRALNTFGAKVDATAIIKPQVKITFPWRLRIGAHSWIGEESWLLSLDRITIGSNVCISQRVLLCTGNHDWSEPNFGLRTKPIVIEDGVWLCANVFVAPGVTIGRNAVATAGSVVTTDLPADMICSGNPCHPVRERKLRERREEPSSN